MVQIDLLADFKCQVLQWYGDTVPMKESSGLLGQKNLIGCEISEVAMNTA